MVTLRSEKKEMKELSHHKKEMDNLWGKVREFEIKLKLKEQYESDYEGKRFCNYPGKDITQELKRLLPEYLQEIEDITGIDITQRQRKHLNKYLEKNRVLHLKKEDVAENRKEFNRLREELRKEWEDKTGRVWPKYKKNVVIEGKIIRKAGSNYDAHHIIENSYGGPPTWWNIHPASFPDQHQEGIHHDEGIASKIFGKLHFH